MSDDWLQHGHEMDGAELTTVFVLVEPAPRRHGAATAADSTWRAVVTGGAVALLATLGVVGVANAIGDNLFPSMGPTSPASVWQNPVPATEPEPDDVAADHRADDHCASDHRTGSDDRHDGDDDRSGADHGGRTRSRGPDADHLDPRRDDDDDGIVVTTLPAPSDDGDPTTTRELERLGVVRELGQLGLETATTRRQRRRLSLSRLSFSQRDARSPRARPGCGRSPRAVGTRSSGGPSPSAPRCRAGGRSACWRGRRVTSSSTSRSRSVSCGPAVRVRRDSSSVRAAFGSSGDPPSCTARIALAMSSGSLCLSR